jgi:hypothetical protein
MEMNQQAKQPKQPSQPSQINNSSISSHLNQHRIERKLVIVRALEIAFASDETIQSAGLRIRSALILQHRQLSERGLCCESMSDKSYNKNYVHTIHH